MTQLAPQTAHVPDLARHPVTVYLTGLSSAQSRHTMARCLNTIAGYMACDGALSCPWDGLGVGHVQAIRARLIESYAPATANKHLAGLKGVIRACWRLDLINTDRYSKLIDIEKVSGSRLQAGRHIAAGELRALFASCASDSEISHRRVGSLRDAALLAVLYSAGIRRTELIALSVDDYDSTTGKLTVRAGKGNKDRIVWIVPGARRSLSAWIDVRGEGPGPLFLPVNRGGKVSHRQLSKQALRGILVRRASRAGVEHLTPHDFRRTHISDLLDAGADIATVAKLVGHSQVTTTALYDRRDERAKQSAASLLHVPC